VRAGIAEQPEKYPWSSYKAYIGKKTPPGWLSTAWLLRHFGKKTGEARKAYSFFVRAAMGATEDPLKASTAGLILGRDEFIEEIRERYLGGKKKRRDIPSLRALTKTSIERILEEAGKELREKPELARKATIYLSHRYSGRSLREIGERFDIGESAVSQASRRFESALQESPLLRKKVERIRKTLSLCNV
jgi:putative transposase